MKIHSFDTRDIVIWDMLKSSAADSAALIRKNIQFQYEKMLEETQSKGISYSSLRTMLTPQKDKREICLIFDTRKIDDSFYGNVVLNEYLPLILGAGNICVAVGDFLTDTREQNDEVYELFCENVNFCNPTDYSNSQQYYLVYLNNLTSNKVTQIAQSLSKFDNFIGFADTTFGSRLKDLISTTVGQRFFISKNKVVLPNPEEDGKDWNSTLYNFEDFNLVVKAIGVISYSSFLTYKIQRRHYEVDTGDQVFSLNAVTSNPRVIKGDDIVIEPAKFEYLLREKGGSLSVSGLDKLTLEEFRSLVATNLNHNYIFNLSYLAEHDTIKFNTVLELMTDETRQLHKYIVAFQYNTTENTLRLVTFY